MSLGVPMTSMPPCATPRAPAGDGPRSGELPGCAEMVAVLRPRGPGECEVVRNKLSAVSTMLAGQSGPGRLHWADARRGEVLVWVELDSYTSSGADAWGLRTVRATLEYVAEHCASIHFEPAVGAACGFDDDLSLAMFDAACSIALGVK